MCVGNSARSQIAEGLAKAMLSKEHQIQSAGSMPSGKVHPGAIACMKSIGIDISNHTSKSIDDLESDFMDNLDYVITLCAEEVCPILPSKAENLHWINEDPANSSYNNAQLRTSFAKTRENLYKLLKKFIIENV